MEEVLNQAEQLEKKSDWLGAAGSYDEAMKLLPEDDFSRMGQICEHMGRAFYRAAMQAESQEEFSDRMHEALANYEKAKEFYGRLNSGVKTSRMSRCDAMIAYAGHWLAAEVPEKKRLLDECWRMGKETLKAFEEAADQFGYGKTCVDLTTCLDDRLDLELDTQMREKILDEALSLGEKAIKIFSNVGDEHELARAYCITSIHCYNAALSLQLETKRRECAQKAFDYLKEATRISKSLGDKLILSKSAVYLGFSEHDLGSGSEAAFKLFKKGVQHAIETKDHCILSEAFDGLAMSAYWNMTVEEDNEKAREKSRECEEYASKAISCSIPADNASGIPHSYSWGYVANFTELAKREITLETRHELLKKAVALGKQGLEYIQRTGGTHAIFHISAELSIALYNLSTMETGMEKRQLLEEALKLGENAVYYTEPLRPHYMWPQALSYEALALTLFELSKLEEKTEKKEELLEKSVSGMEKCITSLQRHLTSFPSRRELFALLGSFQTALGGILSQLYQTNNEKEILGKLVETYQSAAEMYSKAELGSRVAEAYWQVAVAYDHLGEYLESAANFESASKQYELSAHNIPQLNLFYMDYATYMQAWNEIEKARHYHERQGYGSAKEHFEKAAELHRSLKQWCYLVSNYAAWAQVENAEDLSRKERSEEALQAFKEAAKLFSETKRSLQAKLAKIENVDEKKTVTDMLKTTDTRREYCAARTMLEEAKILDKKGEHYPSSEKYGKALEKFEEISQVLESDEERREIKSIISLSRAWQKMMLADARASPEMYMEAAQQFEQASADSCTEAAGLQALGHSRFCRALEAGTRFADTGDPAQHATAIQHLESAAKYYAKAGFQNASEYAKATELLLDAYMYMDDAKREADPDRKARLYLMAERVLQTSAGSFMKAEHPEKREQVLRLLKKVQEERELAVSLTEVLHAPSIISSTKSFATPTPTSEEAVGLERFEHADVQANVIARPKELKVDGNLDLEIQLVNAGKVPALLTKITQVVPEGFQLAEKPEVYPVEDSYLNMKGKRLDPLKTEEVRLILKPKTSGVFSLKPTILYLDENGKYRSHEPEPISITVKELEIEGLHAPALEVSEGATDRIATGYADLDKLLYGGLRSGSAAVLTSPSCNERESLIKSFLKTGAEKGEVTFCVTVDPSVAKVLAEEFPSSFYLFVCNPQADVIVKDSPNMFKLKGVENLTDISIALTSAIRKMDPMLKSPRRICISLVSDVLLQHHAVQTRRWLTGLISELRSNGFTTLTIMDPEMHSPQEVRAVLDLFDGEINIYEKEAEQFLKIKRMSNQAYLEDELLLTKEHMKKQG
jgi:tetratricopeptide (TPR) repeat protein/KaiC/GvpD/RAD55 family RecA-like ATPase